MRTLQTICAAIFFCVAAANVVLWVLNGFRLPRYVHWLALVAFSLGCVGIYGVLMLGNSLMSVFWLPFLFAATVYIVFILHGGGLMPKPAMTGNQVDTTMFHDSIVYDKAEWHSSGDYPSDLPEEQAFVHTGLYLGWIIDNSLYSEEFAEDNNDMIEQFREREVLPSEVYKACDGCLADDMLNPEGNAFSQYYFDFEKGQFLQDYNRLFVSGLPSLYHVTESWGNYDQLKTIINDRYKQWKKNNDSK